MEKRSLSLRTDLCAGTILSICKGSNSSIVVTFCPQKAVLRANKQLSNIKCALFHSFIEMGNPENLTSVV